LQVRGIRGAWRLAARVPHQEVWKWVSLGGYRSTPGDNTVAEPWDALDMCDLQCFGDTLKVGLLDVP